MGNTTTGRYIFDRHPAKHAEIDRLKRLADKYTPSTNALISRFELTGNETILDAGCGLGGALHAFATVTRGLTIGFDLSVELLRHACSTAKKSELNNISVVRGDMSALPFLENTFDLVYSRFALKHVFDPSKAIAELSRVLKVGGKMCLIDKDILAALSLWHPIFPLPTLALIRGINVLNREKHRGGNGNIGRTLKNQCVRNGLQVTSVNIECCPMTPGDGPDADFHREMFLSVYRNSLGILVDRGLISYDEGEGDLVKLDEFLCQEDHFAATLNFVVLAEKNR